MGRTTPPRRHAMNGSRLALASLLLLLPARLVAADPPPVVTDVEGQPVAANAERLTKALDFLGAPLPGPTARELKAAIEAKDARKVQEVLDRRVLFGVSINPEARGKVARGPA